jgi:hypothetical protein
MSLFTCSEKKRQRKSENLIKTFITQIYSMNFLEQLIRTLLESHGIKQTGQSDCERFEIISLSTSLFVSLSDAIDILFSRSSDDTDLTFDYDYISQSVSNYCSASKSSVSLSNLFDLFPPESDQDQKYLIPELTFSILLFKPMTELRIPLTPPKTEDHRLLLSLTSYQKDKITMADLKRYSKGIVSVSS